jgi:hypothetical protein
LVNFPTKKYGLIYADPPWYFKSRSKKGKDRNPENITIAWSIKDICDLPVKDIYCGQCSPFNVGY